MFAHVSQRVMSVIREADLPNGRRLDDLHKSGQLSRRDRILYMGAGPAQTRPQSAGRETGERQDKKRQSRAGEDEARAG